MFVLTLDTATPAVTAGVVELDGDGAVVLLAERITLDSRRHTEALLPQIRDCLTQLEVSPANLGAVVIGVGPGPFTGLRVGVATAQAFADAVELPLYGVCSLDALADAARQAEPLLVATDARRREVYWALYGGNGQRLTSPAVDTPAQLRLLLDDGTVHAGFAVGEGASIYADVLQLPVHSVSYPTCIGLARGARARLLAGAPSEFPRPLYLRRPDATPQVEVREAVAL
ncbi:MAG: tRNA (adenosine(37)-N6)-threonylcarbamoyltransferase complex dimerization subunit type 1 TsaB [Acidimicrobiales bacterium]|nr:MAG: tRNA (adenosine(37)-N6)-threonylcarbamoyltransferase complex dimerization subunit type 1 TsaB [Acidimicrobiales bacterium]